jgi:hypothetical protein
MKLRITLVLARLLLTPLPGRAQSVSFGLTAGLPINQLATAVDGQVSNTGRITFGPSFRVHLPHRFGIDVDLLYKQFDFGFAADAARITLHRLELPLEFRYDFRDSPAHPFVHGGMSFNRVITMGGASNCGDFGGGTGFYCIGGKPAGQLRHEHTYGPVLGAGVDFGWRAIRLSPEIRLTRWVDRNFGTADSPLRSNLTQVEVLLALTF